MQEREDIWEESRVQRHYGGKPEAEPGAGACVTNHYFTTSGTHSLTPTALGEGRAKKRKNVLIIFGYASLKLCNGRVMILWKV